MVAKGLNTPTIMCCSNPDAGCKVCDYCRISMDKRVVFCNNSNSHPLSPLKMHCLRGVYTDYADKGSLIFSVFQLGEVWTEVINELDVDQIRPITPDREALEAISRTVEDRAGHVSMVQKELMDAHDQQSLIDEQEHYAEVRKDNLIKAKTHGFKCNYIFI